MTQSIQHRYELLFFFDCENGNPNGDPDAGNLPRIDPETGQGLVTDVCLKRKIRNYVSLAKGNGNPQPGFEIYVTERAILNQQHEKAYKAKKLNPKKRSKKGKDKLEEDRELTAWMCENFYDIRTFGAVMTTEINCGQVRGPIQFGIARSIEPIVSLEHAVTRCAVTTEREAIAQDGGNRTMGRKFSVPYGLYRVHGFINPLLAEQTGFGDEDLELFKTSLNQMFEYDRSAARGQMTPRRCIAFRHESQLGNARADQLFDRITINPASKTTDDGQPTRSFSDYQVEIDESKLPKGITIESWV